MLSDLPYFNVCKQLPQDVMHIVLEGVIVFELKHFLKYLIEDTNSLTLKKLNSDIKNFHLGHSDATNRPITIKKEDLDHKSSTNLAQTASRMWLLSQILPVILDKYADLSSPQWYGFI